MAREPKPQNPQIDWNHPLSRGLVGAWAFQDGGGSTLRDVSGHGNDGVLTSGGFVWAASPFGGALTFSGSNNVIIEESPRPAITHLENLTVEVWIKTTHAGNYAGVVDRYYGSTNGWAIDMRPATGGGAKTLRWLIWTTGSVINAIGTTQINDGNWHHVVGVRSPTGASLYVDGVLDAYVASTDPIKYSGTAHDIYLMGDNLSTYLTAGDLSGFRIWDRALQAYEINDLYVSPWQMYSRPLLGVGGFGNAYAVMGGAARTPASLSITTHPSGAVSGSPFVTQPVVKLLDASGAVVTGDSSSTVTATIATGAGTLQGTTTVSLSSGVATFTDLQIDEEVAFTLSFSTSAGSFSSSSSSFSVTEAATAGFSDLLALTSGLLSVPPLAATAGYKSIMSMCGVYIDSAGEPLPSGGGGKPARMRRRRIPMVLFDDAEDGIVINAALDSFGAV